MKKDVNFFGDMISFVFIYDHVYAIIFDGVRKLIAVCWGSINVVLSKNWDGAGKKCKKCEKRDKNLEKFGQFDDF